jgi:hypothetical protein
LATTIVCAIRSERKLRMGKGVRSEQKSPLVAHRQTSRRTFLTPYNETMDSPLEW